MDTEKPEDSPAQRDPELRELGPYVVSGEIARGGLGRILEAWDTRLGRPVALKEPLFGGRAVQARFAREARITARLQHPGVVPVYEAGETPEGEPYYVMQYVSGRSLRELIDERSALADRLALVPAVLAAVETVAYAHSRSVIHRDLKPANVLVGTFGETVVIDWGLGKWLDEDDRDDRDKDDKGDVNDAAPGAGAKDGRDGLTQAGSVLGTPAFMPPEQAAGQPVDRRADVYALGAILYNLLADVPPYAVLDADQGLDAIRRGPPRPVVELAPAAPRALVAIVDKAMAHDVEQRYPSAAELACDLRRFQTDQLVRAHRYSWPALAARTIRRHPLAVTLIAAGVVGALGVAQIRSARRSADSSQQLAESRGRDAAASALDARRQGEAVMLREAARWLPHDPARALAGLARYPLGAADWQRATELALEAARLGLPDWVIHAGDRPIAAFSPDGAALAVATTSAIAVVDAATGARQRGWPLALEPSDRIVAVSWSSNERVVVALRSGAVLTFDRASGREARSCARTGATVVASARAAHVVAGAGADGAVTLCDLDSGRIELVHHHRGAAPDVALVDGRALSVGRDGVLAAATLDGRHRARDLGAGGLARVAARASGGRLDVAVGSDAGDLILVDGDSLQIRRRLRHFNARFVKLAWLTGSDTLIVATTDHVVRTVRVADGGEFIVAPGDGFAQSPAGNWIAVAGTEGAVTLFDPRTSWRRTLNAHGSPLHAVSLAADGRMASTGSDGTLRAWSRAHVPERLVGFDGVGAYLDTYPGRDDFAIASDTGQVQLCRASGPCREARLPSAAQALVRLGAVSDPIAVADLERGIIHLFDAALAPLGRLDVGDKLRDVRALGSRLLAVSRDGALYLADAGDRRVERIDPGAACPKVARIRWLSNQRSLLACDGGAIVTFDLAARTSIASARVDGAGATGFAGIGSLQDGSVLGLLASGALHRLGAQPRTLFSCATGGTRLFEASGGHAWISDCGPRVRVVESDGELESIDLAPGHIRVADMDAAGERREVAVGFVDRLVLWSYRDHRVRIVGSSMAVYNVEVGALPDQVVAVSSPGSAQLWNLSAASASTIPLNSSALAAWLDGQAARYRFEPEER